MGNEFRLEMVDFAGLAKWRWVLTAPGGGFVVDHQVQLNHQHWQFKAFQDLQDWLRWHVAPDLRIIDEAPMVAEVGAWAGKNLFGPVGLKLVEQALRQPTTVNVMIPDEPAAARHVASWPLELAHVNGRPLSVQDVSLVMNLGARPPSTSKIAVGERLRMLGLFSLPVGGRPLNLRQERHALVRLFEEIAQVAGRALDFRVLQYGATRDRLRAVLEEAEGWDVVHVSGHGRPGEVLLETENGRPDPISGAELADLLALGRERIKLVTVSACWSAALTAAAQLRLLEITPPAASEPDDEPAQPGLAEAARRAGPSAGGIAGDLVDRLDCAVLAMRYPVTDEFAIGLTRTLYRLLAEKGQPLPRALEIALPAVVAVPPTPGSPALSVATPALFGANAVDLTVKAPPRSGPISMNDISKMAGFPAQPDQFIGRVGVMARCSAALTPRSGASGILLIGMPGAGKTACATEIAYTHEQGFAVLVWFTAPEESREIAHTLNDFCQDLEHKVDGLRLAHMLEDEARFRAFLPQLTELCKRTRLLIVVDNAESLLTDQGGWRDPRWGLLTNALTSHSGFSRLVLTSRRAPAGLDGRVRVERIDALPLDEAVLLARELPHLGALMAGNVPGVASGAARRLARLALQVAQGHPKLLELADRSAADTGRLRSLLEAAGQAWQQVGGLPEGLFAAGEPQAAADDYLHVLACWTRTAAAALQPPANALFTFVCCLEQGDREYRMVEANWTGLWRRLAQPGDPPDMGLLLETVVEHGLVSVESGPAGNNSVLSVHPTVATAGRAGASAEFLAAVDVELALCWVKVVLDAIRIETEQRTALVMHATRSAVPYLLRLGGRHDLALARQLLDEVLYRDLSPTMVAAVLPALRAIKAASDGTEDELPATFTLARALQKVDPATAERELRRVLLTALSQGNYDAAQATSTVLAGILLHSGRAEEALDQAENAIDYVRRANLGPWTQLGVMTLRLQALAFHSDAEQVLGEVLQLREQMAALPSQVDAVERTETWKVREGLLDTGRAVALRLGRFEQALELNAEVIASMLDRRASDSDIAVAWLGRAELLLRVGHSQDAVPLLQECRRVFEQNRDHDLLCMTLGAFAEVEEARGYLDAAVSLRRDALRYAYAGRNVASIATSHQNLGQALGLADDQMRHLVAHYIAAALIRTAIADQDAEYSIVAASRSMRLQPGLESVLSDMTALCRIVGDVPGVDLGRLLGTLAADARTVAGMLKAIMARAGELAAQSPIELASYLAKWDPAISGLLAARRGDRGAAATLEGYLREFEDSQSWARLVGVLRRIAAEDLDHRLFDGLDPIDTAITERTLAVLAGRIRLPPELWRAMRVAPVLKHVVATASGYSNEDQLARQGIAAIAGMLGRIALADTLQRILDGERGADLGAGLTDPTDKAIVATVLEHLAGSGKTRRPRAG